MRVINYLLLTLLLSVPVEAFSADWPTLRHDAERSGRTADEPKGPFVKRWVRFFPGEIMTTRQEAIVADGRVFVGTYAGNLYALDADSGETLWSFRAGGPILHSPAAGEGVVFVASEDGYVYAIDARSGQQVWRTETKADGGFDTSPMLADGRVALGGRNGVFYVLDAKTGAVKGQTATDGPIRTTAAFGDGRFVFASDDMRAYCVDGTGALLWRSEKLPGQSLRDYYPVIIGERVVLRSNPAGPYAERHGADQRVLLDHAGVRGGWQETDKFLKSDAIQGTPEKIESERQAVLAHLERTPDARTFFVLDLATGKESVRMPVLYAAGCQGVGFPPVLTNDGRAIAFYRSAYGNWSHGVAPVVTMGVLDFGRAAVDRLWHTSGQQPPWNTFWGTADESQNFSVGGKTLYVCHQGTLCGLDLETNKLYYIAGNRDTWGGEPGLPWARNEWHGPARGSAAIAGGRLYWLTGSRVICIEGGAKEGRDVGKPWPEQPTSETAPLAVPEPAPVPAAAELEQYVWAAVQPNAAAGDAALGERLDREVGRLLAGERLAPLYVQPGLAGREFFFDSSDETVRALMLAYPHLPEKTRATAKAFARQEMQRFPLWSGKCPYPLDEGRRRERFDIPKAFLQPSRHRAPHPLGNLYALWLYVDRTGDAAVVEENWAAIKGCYEDFAKTNWRLDPDKCDVFGNRYIGGLIALARLAKGRDEALAGEAARRAAESLAALLESYQRGLAELRPVSLRSIQEVDRFIGGGNSIFCSDAHSAKIAKFLDLTPEIAAAVRDHAGEAARAYLRVIDLMMPGWYLAWEERQVHFGENFADYPDQALSILNAKALIAREADARLERALDLPWCEGDLFFIEKIVRILERRG